MGVTSHWFTNEGSGTVVHPFLTLDGSLFGTATRPERVMYKGVDGIGFWFDGLRGKPFTIETSCDYASLALAGTAHGSYLSSIGTKKDLYYNGLLFGTVAVSDVELKQIQQLGTTVGGINVSGAAGVLIRATWTIEKLP